MEVEPLSPDKPYVLRPPEIPVEVNDRLIASTSPGTLFMGDGSAPDQSTQLEYADLLLHKLGLFNSIEENPPKGDGSHTIDLITRNSLVYDPSRAGGNDEKISVKIAPLGSPTMRLRGVDGNFTQPLAYTLYPSIAFDLIETERKEKRVADKYPSSKNPVEDGKVVADVLSSYKSRHGDHFWLKHNNESGRVRVILPSDQFDTHHIQIGVNKIVGLEFQPIAMYNRAPSEFNHGQIAFLTLK